MKGSGDEGQQKMRIVVERIGWDRSGDLESEKTVHGREASIMRGKLVLMKLFWEFLDGRGCELDE